MSVGKCTYRYIRVKPMNPASTRAGTPSLRFCSQSAKAAAKAEAVMEEYLTVNQHLSREVEGRLVVEA